MPGRKKPKCTYATLKTGADRTAAFKKHIMKMMNGGKKKKKKRIIGPNHVSQIMKRRAAKARAEKQASEEVHRAAYERRVAAERAEKFSRAFFGTKILKVSRHRKGSNLCIGNLIGGYTLDELANVCIGKLMAIPLFLDDFWDQQNTCELKTFRAIKRGLRWWLTSNLTTSPPKPPSNQIERYLRACSGPKTPNHRAKLQWKTSLQNRTMQMR